MTKRNSSSRLAKQFAVNLLCLFEYIKPFQEMNVGGDDILDHGETAKHENRFVFECSWEVANKGNRYFGGDFTPIFSWWHLHSFAFESSGEYRRTG